MSNSTRTIERVNEELETALDSLQDIIEETQSFSVKQIVKEARVSCKKEIEKNEKILKLNEGLN